MLRLPGEYPLTRADALAMIRADIPDFTEEEFDTLVDNGRIYWIYINGEVHYFHRFYETLLKTEQEIAIRAGKAKREKATHGFGPGHPAENCLLAVRGRGIREGVTMPAMPMRDVAPTLAGLMGIRLPQAVGEDHSQMIKMD